MVWVSKSPPEGCTTLKFNKGVYPLNLGWWRGFSEDPAENAVQLSRGRIIVFFGWSIVRGWNITSWWVNQTIWKIFVKLDHETPRIGMNTKTVLNHQMFFLFNDTWTKEASPRTKDSEAQNRPVGKGRIDAWWSSDLDPTKTSWFLHLTCQPFPLNIPANRLPRMPCPLADLETRLRPR